MKSNHVKCAYAAYIKQADIRISSSSGGVFTALAEYVITCGGVVYGVAMSKNCREAEYSRIDKVDELEQIRTSKYLQAKMKDTYQKVKSDLENNLFVLFSGVGCQINGLRHFLGRTYENLLCVDVICHGVPSPKLWKRYIDEVEKQYRERIQFVNFRCKYLKWKKIKARKKVSDKVIFSLKGKNPYMLMFLDNYCLRPSCYACTAKYYKLSDVTLGDFWGIEKIDPDLNDGKGISLVIIRSSIGEKLLNCIKSNIFLKEVSYKEAVSENIAEFRSVDYPIGRRNFFRDLDSSSFKKIRKYYAVPERNCLRRKLRNAIKKEMENRNGNYGVLLSFEKKKISELK